MYFFFFMYFQDKTLNHSTKAIRSSFVLVQSTRQSKVTPVLCTCSPPTLNCGMAAHCKLTFNTDAEQ